jgi:hypothetical protein
MVIFNMFVVYDESSMADQAVSKNKGNLQSKLANDRSMGNEIDSKKGELKYTEEKAKTLRKEIQRRMQDKKKQDMASGIKTENYVPSYLLDENNFNLE